MTNKMIVKVYDGVKYDIENTKKIAELTYMVIDYAVRRYGESAEFDAVIDSNYTEDEKSTTGEYLELMLEDGETATFRNDRVDLFRW